jgi:hypothetical protein
MKKLLFFILLALGALCAPVNAQQQLQALIVPACGTPPVSYVAGTYGILTMDTTGKLCDGGGGGGGGTQNVNLTQILGAAPSATNQLWVSPATGATFPVSGTFWQATQPVSGAASAFVDGWDLTQGTKADAAYVGSGSASVVSLLKGLYSGITSAVPAGTNNIGNVGQVSPYPATAVPITASATGTTAATTATLTNVTGHTTYICGFSIRANATAAVTNNATVTGTITGTLNFTQWTAPLASGIGVTEEVFSPCVPASAVSTSIAVVSGAPGSGGVVSVTAWGYSI